MSARLRPGDDPDLEQAIADLAPVFAKLREAKAQLPQLRTKGMLKDLGHAQAVIDDCVGRIQARAERIAVPAMGLRALLDVHTDLKAKQRRRPSRTMMRQVLAARVNESAKAVDKLRAELAKAERTAEATAAAQRIYTGRSS